MIPKKIALISTCLMMSLSHAYAVESPTMTADKNAIYSACANDAAAIHCPAAKGMGKCMHDYKKAHKTMKWSPNCQAAYDQLRDDMNAHK